MITQYTDYRYTDRKMINQLDAGQLEDGKVVHIHGHTQ